MAANGMEGITLTCRYQPDVMLVDLGLPGIAGFTVAQRLHGIGYRGCLIALSGFGHQEAKEKAKELGFEHHLVEPTDFQAIAAIFPKSIRRLLQT